MAEQSIFRNMAGQMPRQNQQVTQSLQEGARMRSQEAIKQASQAGVPLGVQTQQALATQAAAGQAQPIVQQAQKQAQQAKAIQGLSLQQTQQTNQQQLRERQLNLTKQSRDIQSRLSRYDQRLSNQLWQENLKFNQDELGRTVFNERQLADFAIISAKSDIEYKQFEQKMRQASDRKLKLLEMAQKRILQEMEQSFKQGEAKLNREQSLQLAEMKRKVEEKIKREQARARNRASMFNAGGTLLGAAAGAALVGTGAGAAALLAGAAAGGSLGGGIGNIFSSF